MNPMSESAPSVELLGGLRTNVDMLASIEEALRRREEGRPAWEYFDRRVKTHNEAIGLPVGQPLPRPLGGSALAGCLAQPGSGQRAMIYVHIPFCRQICSFCAFFRQPCSTSEIGPYVSALSRQIARFAQSPYGSGCEIDAVYFGGGTPTVLSPDQLGEILGAIRSGFRLSGDCEVTVESRIDGVDRTYVRALGDVGVNRVSFGVQSFDSGVRRHVGRIAGREEVLRVLSEAAESGVQSISTDLIYNLPGQDCTVWKRDLESLSEVPVTGASVYTLIPFKRSVLARHVMEGKEAAPGGIDVEYQCHSSADEYFSGRSDWRRCSPVHYGKIGVETNRYNDRRAAPIDIFGFGAGGGGRIGDILFMNPVHVGRFLEDQQGGCDDHLFAIRMDPRYPEAMRGFALTDTLALAEDQVPGCVPTFHEVLEELVDLGLVVRNRTGWELTPAGRFWAYNISAAIAQAIRRDLAGFDHMEVQDA